MFRTPELMSHQFIEQVTACMQKLLDGKHVPQRILIPKFSLYGVPVDFNETSSLKVSVVASDGTVETFNVLDDGDQQGEH